MTIGAGGNTFTAAAQIVSVAPGVFALNAQSLCAAQVLRVRAEGTQILESVYRADASGNVTALPIDFGAASDQIYLILFATGVRNARNVSVTVGTASIPVLFAGPQGQFVGEDQINVGPLPRSLAGSGKVNVAVLADGIVANATNLTFQ